MCVGEKLHVVIFVLTMVISLKGWRKGGKRKREGGKRKREGGREGGQVGGGGGGGCIR